MVSMKVRMFLFFLPMLALVVYAHVYLYRTWIKPLRVLPWVRGLFIAVSASAIALGFGTRAVSVFIDAEPPRVLVVGSLIWAGFLLYVLLFTGVWAAWTRYQKKTWTLDPDRRHLLGAGVAAIAGGLSAHGIYRAYGAPEVSETVVRLPNLPKALEGFSFAQISDIHVGSVIQHDYLRELVARTNAVKADAIVITGDLVDGTVARLGRYVRELQALSAKNGVHFITGNHDYYSGASAWCAALESLGLNVLRNRSVELQPGLRLAGVDDWSAKRFGEAGYDLDAALLGFDPKSIATVLLAHQPSNFDAVAEKGPLLQLSGHTHGGQFFPITVGADLLWGSKSHGLSAENAAQIYVSRGSGFVGPPFRTGAPPEIAKIVLVSG
jgi:uncharacterized protein